MSQAPPTFSAAIERIGELFEFFGERHYGEACNQLQHAISSAVQGEERGCDEAMVLAAFLHDIGHFVADELQLPGFDEWGYSCHDSLGADFLRDLGLGPEITEPIRLHVAAKRFLASQADPLDSNGESPRHLSLASATTLQQQGGGMSASESEQFRQSPWFQQALTLRQLDDAGKPEQMPRADLNIWLQRLQSYMQKVAN